jgi:hypothetical protein
MFSRFSDQKQFQCRIIADVCNGQLSIGIDQRSYSTCIHVALSMQVSFTVHVPTSLSIAMSQEEDLD